MDLRPHLWPRPRARGLRKLNDSNTSGGVQAGAAAAPKQVDVGFSPGNAADWAAAQLPVQPQSQRVRATATATTDSTAAAPLMRQTRLHLQAASAAYFRQTPPVTYQLQDLNVVVVAMLDRKKALIERLKAMDVRLYDRTTDLHKRTYDLHKRLKAMEVRYNDLHMAHNKLEDEMQLCTEHCLSH